MSVWFCIPSARPPEEAEPVIRKWIDQGYYVALWFDDPRSLAVIPYWNISICHPYPGYAVAVNSLIKAVMDVSTEADWFICAGDDTLPDPTKRAKEIARECSDHFRNLNIERTGETIEVHPTFGVMQATGDRWHEGVGGFTNAPIDRVCGSPWMGREFCKRMYRGNGPLFEGYQHMFVDEELQEVALKLGVLWQRRDLTHFHKHWGRGETDKAILSDPKIPPHLVKWNTPEHWKEAKALFDSRKAAGFPGSDPL
jgi:hypothetical protein